MAPVASKLDGREMRSVQTRRRLVDAARAEFKRVGVTDADLGTIAANAGMARATFYFHFPTKHHVVLELERLEEARIAIELARYLRTPHSLPEVLSEVVRLVVSSKRRLGASLFRTVLGLHFAPTRPPDDDWTRHPVIVGLVAEITRHRDQGRVFAGADPFRSALFFLLGLYALLSNAKSVSLSMLDSYVATSIRSMATDIR